MLNEDKLESIIGCLISGAIGDAMGQPYEGKSGPIEYMDYSPWKISDDTQMTLATCEAIIKTGNVSPEDIANQFLVWFRQKRITGMGASTLKAMRDLDVGAHWALSGAQGENTMGNGAAMRIAPLAFFLDARKQEDRVIIRDVCRITHQSDESYIGALAILLAIQSPSIENLFSSIIENLPDSRVRDRMMEINKSAFDLEIKNIGAQYGSSAYVVDSVPLAIFAARQILHKPMQNIIREVVETGGDTDTIASMAGQIIGAWYGSTYIQKYQLDKIPHLNQIKKIAADLFKVFQNGKIN